MDISTLTTVDREFIDYEYMMELSGMKEGVCRRIIQQVKKCSDTCGISGVITRADWIFYLSRHGWDRLKQL